MYIRKFFYILFNLSLAIYLLKLIIALPSPNNAVHMLINTIRIVSAHIFARIIFVFLSLYII